MYKLTENKVMSGVFEGTVLSTSIRRLSDGASIPFDTANTDYAQFKKDILEGAELQDAEGNTMSAEQATQFVKELP